MVQGVMDRKETAGAVTYEEARNRGLVFPAEAAKTCGVSRRRIMVLISQDRMGPVIMTDRGRMLDPMAVARFQQERQYRLAVEEPDE